jgi:magnesium transporter
MAANWVDLLDPTPEEIRARSPRELEDTAFELLTAQPQHEDEPRPTLWSHGDYVFGIFLLAVAIPEEDSVYYQEIGVIATCEEVLTVRKTPARGKPYDPAAVRAAVRDDDSGGMIVYRIVDDLAERYLDLVDALDSEIDELEDRVDVQSAELTRQRISELRHDMLHIRRTLAPMRDAVRRVVVNAVEVDEGQPEVFPQPVEVAFNNAYDKLMRALDGLELTRDLLGSVRDYAQAKIANDQNEVMKRLTVIASLLLVPTFIVGLYGQNFHNMPELRWRFGYAYVWGLIIATTVLQLWYFRRKRWI